MRQRTPLTSVQDREGVEGQVAIMFDLSKELQQTCKEPIIFMLICIENV